jgi:lipid-A-disaccharide synthase
MTEVMLIAAEASSSLFAQRLLEHWKKSRPDLKFFGVGRAEMERFGFERIGKSESMAVVGIAEVIEHYAELKDIFNKLVEAAKARRPQVVVLMDYPEFNLRLARALHAEGIPVVYYISPQIWAWRKGRVHTIKKYCQKMFVLFPFEMKFYEEHQVPVEFIGHPLLDELTPQYEDEGIRQIERSRRGYKASDIVLGLMPGSRRSELKLHLQTQIQVAKILHKQNSNIKFLFIVAPSFSRESFIEQMGEVSFPYQVIQEQPFAMIQLTDMILVASGTATLQVGLMKKPMVIMYKLKPLTWVIAKLIVRGVKFFGIVNLILGKEAVPERLQGAANPENLAMELSRYVNDSQYRQAVISDLAKLQNLLGSKGATARLVQRLDSYLGRAN